MYDNSYEDYMRSVLGYPYNSQVAYNTYGNVYEDVGNYFPYRSGNTNVVVMDESRFENRYPEIYKILKPMVGKACSNNYIDNVSAEVLESMADDIYRNVCSDVDVVNINVTTENRWWTI